MSTFEHKQYFLPSILGILKYYNIEKTFGRDQIKRNKVQIHRTRAYSGSLPSVFSEVRPADVKGRVRRRRQVVCSPPR